MPLDFSIIIPTYGRPVQLATCLRSLAALDYPRDRWEVIVVDDGSPQPVKVEDISLPVTVLRQANAGPASARNAGTAQARGRWLGFIDDDCTAAPDWLTKLAARLTAAPTHLIGGRVVNALPANPYATASQSLLTYLYGYYNADPNRARFVTSNNLAVARDGFGECGGFDENLPRGAGEDRELCDRWRAQGRTLVYAPEAVVQHAHQMGWRGFCRQHFQYGRAAHYFHEVRARRGGGPLRVEPPRFYLNLMRFPFTQQPPCRPRRLAVLFLVSQVANAAGFFWERTTRGYEQKRH